MGRYTIAVTVNNRHRYIDDLVAALLGNDLAGFDLVLAVEPHFHQACELPRIDIPGSVRITKNSAQRGVRDNPFVMLEMAFRDYDGVLYLEDDLLIAPDVTSLARWYLDHPIAGTPCLNLCNHNATRDARPDVVTRTHYYQRPDLPGFNPLGLVITREQWGPIAAHWYTDPDGWDLSILRWMASEGIATLGPEYSRVTHRPDAADGTHYRPEMHAEQFATRVLYDGPSLPYRLA